MMTNQNFEEIERMHSYSSMMDKISRMAKAGSSDVERIKPIRGAWPR